MSVKFINNKIIEVEAMNLAACKLAQKLVCLEEIKDKFDVVSGSAESNTDKRSLPSLKENTIFSGSLVACVVDESHTVNTGTGCIAGQLGIVARISHRSSEICLQ